MNPWLTALDGLGTIAAVLTPVFAWDYLWHHRGRARAAVAPAPRRAEPVPLESASPAEPFDSSAVVIDRQGAPRVSAIWEESP